MMDKSGREQKSKKDLLHGSEGGGKRKESQRQMDAAKARARLEVKLKRRLLRTTKAGGNRLGQRERRREVSAAAAAAAGSLHVKGGRLKTGGSAPGAGRGKVGRVEPKSGGKGGDFSRRSSNGVAQKKEQMIAHGSDERRLPAKGRGKNEPEKKNEKLHPSWIAKIEQLKKAVQLNVAAGKKIKFDDDDDD
ncbi:hypothetical protein CBR_g19266 [Chara braunii]|uniref:Bud22 domain-containing protein n=1 Tax=Chara braunii TaxID=69332 RepID=A0A388KXS5_CHABU|nr:hypothetical protein CBR_g19266 [Chara braunii]|eukprot:GBG74753.1 hypothetical protein CBR_g19266 [Chara braunii]